MENKTNLLQEKVRKIPHIIFFKCLSDWVLCNELDKVLSDEQGTLQVLFSRNLTKTFIFIFKNVYLYLI